MYGMQAKIGLKYQFIDEFDAEIIYSCSYKIG